MIEMFVFKKMLKLLAFGAFAVERSESAIHSRRFHDCHDICRNLTDCKTSVCQSWRSMSTCFGLFEGSDGSFCYRHESHPKSGCEATAPVYCNDKVLLWGLPRPVPSSQLTGGVLATVPEGVYCGYFNVNPHLFLAIKASVIGEEAFFNITTPFNSAPSGNVPDYGLQGMSVPLNGGRNGVYPSGLFTVRFDSISGKLNANVMSIIDASLSREECQSQRWKATERSRNPDVFNGKFCTAYDFYEGQVQRFDFNFIGSAVRVKIIRPDDNGLLKTSEAQLKLETIDKKQKRFSVGSYAIQHVINDHFNIIDGDRFIAATQAQCRSESSDAAAKPIRGTYCYFREGWGVQYLHFTDTKFYFGKESSDYLRKPYGYEAKESRVISTSQIGLASGGQIVFEPYMGDLGIRGRQTDATQLIALRSTCDSLYSSFKESNTKFIHQEKEVNIQSKRGGVLSFNFDEKETAMAGSLVSGRENIKWIPFITPEAEKIRRLTDFPDITFTKEGQVAIVAADLAVKASELFTPASKKPDDILSGSMCSVDGDHELLLHFDPDEKKVDVYLFSKANKKAVKEEFGLNYSTSRSTPSGSITFKLNIGKNSTFAKSAKFADLLDGSEASMETLLGPLITRSATFATETCSGAKLVYPIGRYCGSTNAPIIGYTRCLGRGIGPEIDLGYHHKVAIQNPRRDGSVTKGSVKLPISSLLDQTVYFEYDESREQMIGDLELSTARCVPSDKLYPAIGIYFGTNEGVEVFVRFNEYPPFSADVVYKRGNRVEKVYNLTTSNTNVGMDLYKTRWTVLDANLRSFLSRVEKIRNVPPFDFHDDNFGFYMNDEGVLTGVLFEKGKKIEMRKI